MSSTAGPGLLTLAIGPKTSDDAQKLAAALQQLTAEDPTLHAWIGQTLGHVVIGGVSEQHLEVVVARLAREFHVEASVGRPEVAYRQANAIVLEPVMRVEVVVPTESVADVIRNLLSRRGVIRTLEECGETQVVRAVVPLAELFGYAVDLSSRTFARGRCAIEFEDYAPLPPADDDDDRDSLVRAPRKPLPPLRGSRIALPEPD